MLFDLAFAFIVTIAALLGLRGGVLPTLVAAGVLSLAAIAGIAAHAWLALAGLGAWLALFAVLTLALGSADQRLTVRFGMLGLGLVQGVVAVVLLAGLLLGTVYRETPAAAEKLRLATLYAPVAALGSRVAPEEQSVALAFPTPVDDVELANETPVPTIDWADVRPFNDDAIRALPGEIRAIDRTPLAFEVEGRVTEVNVDIGEHFEEGDTLAQLDTYQLEIALQERRAALIEAEARFEEAQQEYERQSALFERDVVAETIAETALASLDAARSRYEIALRGIETAEDRLEDATLRAPYDGSVATRLIEPAQTISAGAPALEIQSNGGGFEITATIPDTLVSQLQVGTSHEVTLLDGSDITFSAELRDIGSRATSTSGFPVTLRIPSPNDALRAGMSVEIAFRLSSNETGASFLAVPVNAIWSNDDGGFSVFRIDPETSTLVGNEITLAGTEAGLALVADGLSEGDIVATRGIPFLDDGMAVHLRGTGVARYDD
ncbi:efflux RND transporter periplasmic adaptor subunit [Pontivivens ytuae]|uniref:Efflux RND transporter periplasmic adaptor subunit n=1 Tax=Pontivivens ytuae TaxID=2789856 RepID=A0A7S9LT49_9RHOB|nr:efflux RND transporter periplasmic adaptor subunit [Pontivivens ytuae]QPH54240.1 efflux RND transporter periplasmic adaptor subunit [Pontivivens ytuae]